MRPELPGTRHEFVEANDQRFSVATAGEGDHLALCLHGFPECWYSWRRQIPFLVDRGYRVWAPDLRGYGESSRPPRISDYSVEELLADVSGLIDASGATPTTLISHDWGGMIAWWFAMRKLRPLERLVVFNAPHPGTSVGSVGWRQRLRSAYVLFFQLPRLPELVMGRDARGVVRAIQRLAGSPDAFSEEELEIFRLSAARPGAMTAMLNYYRALGRGGGFRRQSELGSPPIDVPTLLVWGTEDGALSHPLTHGLEPFVPDLTIRYLPGIGHWSQQEAADDTNRILGAWLDGVEVPILPGEERFREPSLDARVG